MWTYEPETGYPSPLVAGCFPAWPGSHIISTKKGTHIYESLMVVEGQLTQRLCLRAGRDVVIGIAVECFRIGGWHDLALFTTDT